METIILHKIAEKLGNISNKGIENTIRFIEENGNTNIETRHSHFQHKYSILYCIRGDKAAKTHLASANTIINNTDKEMKILLTTPHCYIPHQKSFPLIQLYNGQHKFSSQIFGRSDIEETIEDLDLPDAMKMLHNIRNDHTDKNIIIAINYLINQLEKNNNNFTFQPGDLALVNEASTIRYSKSYRPTHSKQGKERWLLAASISH